MDPRLQRLDRAEIPAETSRPDPARLVAGDPVHTTWNVEEGPALHTGFWHSTAGAWKVAYEEWEYVHILEGHSVLTSADGSQVHLRAGDNLVIRPGFAGVWEVREATLKEYVIVV